MLLGTQKVNSKGHLEIGGCDVVELAARFGTPLYIMDEALIRQRCREYREAFGKRYPNNDIAFAGKAFITTAMCRIIKEEDFSLDVASGGELYTAMHAKFPADRIVFHGNNKSEEEIVMSLECNVGKIVIDSLLEIDMIDHFTRKAAKKANVLLRCTPGIDPHTHRKIRTGQEDSKFGLNIKDGSAFEGVKKLLACQNVRLKGLHCHVGSQLLDMTAHKDGINVMVDFMKILKDELNFNTEELDIGGGLGIRYLSTQNPPSIDEFADEITSTLIKRLNKNELDYPKLMQEPGRSIVGEAGTTAYTIGVIKNVTIKEEPGKRTYVAIDGGLSDNPRPQLYDSKYEAILANKADKEASNRVTIAGKHCETDILIWDVDIAKPEPGDVLAVQSTGAYNYAMASNYNMFLKPPVVLVNNGKSDVIVERETYNDLIAHDKVPERLK